jgi:Glycosyltransferase 61
MFTISEKYKNKIKTYEHNANPFLLFQKSVVLLYQSKSWTVLGLRIINRLCSQDKKVPFFLRFIFPKSAAWFDVKVATEKKSNDELTEAVRKLIEFKKVFYDYNLVEISIDFLLANIEERNAYAFQLMYQKRINDYRKDSALYEIHNSFFLKKIPRIHFHIDEKRFLFLLPINYLFKFNSHKARLKDYEHRFLLPSKIDQPSLTEHTAQIDGDRIWELQNVKLVKGYQVIDDRNYFCYEQAADPVNEFIAGHFDAKAACRHLEGVSYARVNISKYTFQYMDSAFLVSGRCTRNYFHWLVEYLPKLLWFTRDTGIDFNNVVLAVDKYMPPQHYQALEFVLNKLNIQNPIVKINPDENIYNFNRLILCSNPTFIPDGLNEYNYPESSVMNLESLAEYRDLMLKCISNEQKRRIYIARTNKMNRKLINEEELIEIFVKHGFEIVYPENYSFEDQINLFNSAEAIAGPAGAAFSNLIFCQSGTKVINFLAEENKEAAIFSNLCALSDSSYCLLTGNLLKDQSLFPNKVSWLYSEFKVDTSKLDQNLANLLNR